MGWVNLSKLNQGRGGEASFNIEQGQVTRPEKESKQSFND